MPQRLTAEAVLEWLDLPHTDLGWLLAPTPVSGDQWSEPGNYLMRLFKHGADSEGWDLLWPKLLHHPLVNAFLETQWEGVVLPWVFTAPGKCARPLLDYWASHPQDTRPVRLETSPDPAVAEHLPVWLVSLLHAQPPTTLDTIIEALDLAATHGWLIPHQPVQLKDWPQSLPMAFYLATYPGRHGARMRPGSRDYVERVLGVFERDSWQLPEISDWLSHPHTNHNYATWLEQGLRSGFLLGRKLPVPADLA